MKVKISFLLIGGVLLLLLPPIVNGKGDQEIVLYLPFDEGKGNTTADESGFGHDAEIFKAKWVDGKFGKALEFSGAGHYAQTKPNKKFVFDTKDEISVMAWINVDLDQIGAIIYNRPVGNTCNYGFRVENMGISWFYQEKGEAGWHGVQSAPPSLIPLNEWVHVAATNIFGEGKDEMKVYLNGKELDTILGWGPGKADPMKVEGPIEVGARWQGADHLFSGIIDEPSIWRGLFSEDDLQEIMQGPTTEYLAVQPHKKLATTWGALKQSP